MNPSRCPHCEKFLGPIFTAEEWEGFSEEVQQHIKTARNYRKQAKYHEDKALEKRLESKE